MSKKDTLQNLGLNTSNCIVIGSGILGALGIRGSADIDVVVTGSEYGRLEKTGDYSGEINHGKPVLVGGDIEIFKSWMNYDSGEIQGFEQLLPHTVVIDEVRYMSLEMLLKIKRIWARDHEGRREKDLRDVGLIEGYLKENSI